MRQLVYIEICQYGKIADRKKICVNNHLIWNRVFLPQMCRELVSCADPVEGRVVSARSNSNGRIRVDNATTLRGAAVACLITSLWGKPKRWIWRQSFRSSQVFRPPKHKCLELNLSGFMELLFLLRFGTFPFEEEAICGVTSGQRCMERSAFPFF